MYRITGKNHIRRGLLAFAGLLVAAPHALAINVSVQTTDCEGSTGFASFESTRLAKIQDAPCADPADRSKKLKQVMLHTDRPLMQYEVITVDTAGSESIMNQIKGISDAELENLNRPDILIEQNTTTRRITPPPASPTRGTTEQSDVSPPEQAVAPPPQIEVSDPPITRTRSMTNVITEPGLTQRQIIGTVRSANSVVSLTVNGRSQQLSEHGLFEAAVTMTNERTPVTIIAVDNHGASSKVEFHLVRSSPAPESSTASSTFGNYHALVIANADYEKLDDLVTPLNDGREIARILADNYGFSVTTLFNASRYDIMSTMNDLRRDLTENDNLLIYFAGHGAYDKANNRGHWLPVDAEHNSTANWVSTIDVTDIVNAMSARHILVVADSCYSGALTRSEHTELDPGMSDDLRSRWLQAVAKTRSRHLLTSGGIKPVVDDGGNGHSVFANALIEVLSGGVGIIESSTIYHQVNALVKERSKTLALDQNPRYAKLKRTGHEFGEFLMISRQ